MCSIEEAWAGQTFSGKPVSSQADIHKSYMSLPDDIITHNNQFSMKASNEPQSTSLSRGINSKYSREPRVPNINRTSDNANINFSSTMPPLDNYGGLKPRPDYMEVYDKSVPMPVMSGEQFTDINNAFEVSNTVNNFMERGMNNELLNEDTSEENNFMNIKYNNKQNKNDFSNVKVSSRYNSSNDDYNDNNHNNNNNKSTESRNVMSSSDTQILFILQQLVNKLDKIERDLHHHQSRNTYDIILYILIGMIIAFILYSMFSSMKNK
jgi:hypothetical protein